jgi:PhnB protein
MPVQPYLFFEGRCEEALAFYREALGAEVNALMRYKESPDQPPPEMGPIPGDKVMHVSFRIGDTELMASDGMASGKPEFRGFSLSVTARDAADAKRRFEALANGGTIQMPLGKTFFSPCFGMVQDRFGVSWMIIVLPA